MATRAFVRLLSIAAVTILGMGGCVSSTAQVIELRPRSPRESTEWMARGVACADCHGTGTLDDEACETCEGHGVVEFISRSYRRPDYKPPDPLPRDDETPAPSTSTGLGDHAAQELVESRIGDVSHRSLLVPEYRKPDGTLVDSHIRTIGPSDHSAGRPPLRIDPQIAPLVLPGVRVAENGSYYGQPNAWGAPRVVHVNGYYRRDGTYVRGHYRARPR